MIPADEGKLDPAVVAALYAEHAEQLRRFVLGVVRDAQLAQDVLQATFAKMVEVGQGTRAETRKAWLFRVAYHEALRLRRRDGVRDRAVRRIAETAGDAQHEPADRRVARDEMIAAVRDQLEQLPAAQQQVVRLRIYEGLTFAEIAKQLDAPLGTVLGRMHTALAKLKLRLRDFELDD